MSTDTIDVAELQQTIAKKDDLIRALSDIIENHGLAMGAALLEEEIGKGPSAGLEWIRNTLAGPGLLPDIEEAKALGGPQAWFDKGVADRAGLLEKLQAAMKPAPLRLDTAIDVECAANDFAAAVRAAGFVVTIDQQSTQPPAMGRHVDVVSVRVKREPS